MLVSRSASVFLACFACAVPAAAQPSFSVIATTGGQPAIGAISFKTLFGTDASAGLLFRLSITTGKAKALHSFVAATDGSALNARLALGTGGTVWGAAQSGGAYGGGTLFEYGQSGFSVAHAFGNGTDGSGPLQGLVTAGGSAFIGTTAGGAIGTNGNLFEYATRGTYSMLHDFMSGGDGHCPFSGPTRTPTGAIYGTTIGRGFGGNPNGSIWKYTSGVVKTVYLFQNGNDGEWPDQAPVGDAQGNVYGTTHIQGGNEFAGAVWKLTASGVFTVLHDFDAATDGFQPNSPLVLNTDGYLYGTTLSGGAKNLGTVFRISTSGSFQVEHSFAGGTDGGNPTGSLVHDASGAIYGGTASGTVFRITN